MTATEAGDLGGDGTPRGEVAAGGRSLSRRERLIRAELDVTVGCGLEVGPLQSPIVVRGEADIHYVDVVTTEGLREHYKNDGAIDVARIVDVDYALTIGDRIRSLEEATAEGAPFDWIVASHVIEHVPDLIGWLKDLATIMSDGARLALAVPDRRFTFDAARPVTSVGDLLLAHYNNDTRPSHRALFEYFSEVRAVDYVELWRGAPPDESPHIWTLDEVPDWLERSAAGEYVDSHVWVFSPTEFARQFDVLSRFGMLDFAFVALTPTARWETEFYVTLERLPRGLNREDARAIFEASYGAAILEATSAAAPEVEGEAPEVFELSARERRLVEMKRGALQWFRRFQRQR